MAAFQSEYEYGLGEPNKYRVSKHHAVKPGTVTPRRYFGKRAESFCGITVTPMGRAYAPAEKHACKRCARITGYSQ